VVSREAVFQALFARVSAATWGEPAGGFAYASRRVRLSEDLPATPALLQAEHAEEVERIAGQPPRRWLVAELRVHHLASDPQAPGAATNNLILDALDHALRPDGPDGCCTLGGLVAHAAIEGEIAKDPGDLDGRALLVAPVRLLLP
jgi:hypothetical protein